MGSYYCLVAGLSDVTFDGAKVGYTVEKFREELYPQLTDEDKKIIDLFFYIRDNENILTLLRYGNDVDFLSIGCYTKSALQEIIEAASNGDNRSSDVPAYIYDFLEFYFQNSERTDVVWEDVLSGYYYSYAIGCRNKFVSDWFTFNMNVNNILVALLARKYKLSISDCVLGDNEVAEALRTSATRDFGLVGVVDYFETILRISENDKLQERERQLDEMRWAWLDDNSVFKYFTIERLFVFLQKLDMVERWAKLDVEKGMQRYNEIIEELKDGKIAVENV